MLRSGLALGVTLPCVAAAALAIGCEGALGLGSYTIGNPDASTGGMDSMVDSTVPPIDGSLESGIDSAMVGMKDTGAADTRVADSKVVDSQIVDTGAVIDTNEDTCTGEGGCYACTPTVTQEFLNACTGSMCQPFDDQTRIPGFDGGLPPVTAPDSAAPDTGTVGDSSTADVVIVDSAVADTSPPPPPPPCPSTNQVFVTGSSAILPLLSAIAQQLTQASPPVSVIYQKPGSCQGVNDVLNGVPITGQTAIGWSSPTDPGTTCQLPSSETTQTYVDIGVSDVFPQSCDTLPNGLPSGIQDFPGPIQTETFVVPVASQQYSISAAGAYYVWSLGTQSGVAPWNVSNSQLFRRNANSGTQVMISFGIGVLPATDWRGIDCGSAQNVASDVANTLDPVTANETIGILALTDLTQADALQVRVLAYKHYDQDCSYTPSTTATSRDLANVRDGHYALWGPLHFLTHVDTNGIPLNPLAKQVIGYFDGTLTPPGNLNLLQLEALYNVIPQCAMHVSRSSEIGPLSPYAPIGACDCYYELEATGTTTCQSCTVSSTCPTSAPVCNLGFCEPQ